MLTHRPRNWFSLLLAAATVHPACSTKSVGVEECRRIEYARCEAAPNCPEQFNVTNVEQCRLFYRDHCLHGLPLPAAPNTSSVNNCVEALKLLSGCAADESGPSTPIAACEDAGVRSNKPKLTTVCQLLAQPEAIPECSFIVGDSTAGGGQTGSGGTTGNGGATDSASSGGTDTSGQGGTTDVFGFGGLTL